jgi:hypothetical protein
VIANVKVVAINTGTNLTREAVTDESGTYRIPALNPGPYRLEAETVGFKKATASDIVLEVGQQARVDVEMQVGDVTQTLEVDRPPSLGEHREQQIGGVINQSRVVSLPLNGRNFMELTTLTAGIAEGTGAAAIVNNAHPPPPACRIRTTTINSTAPTTRKRFFNSWNVGPSVDAIQEFSIQVGQYSAEFGSGGGAVITWSPSPAPISCTARYGSFLRN